MESLSPSEVDIGRGFVLAAYRCFKRKTKPSGLIYDTKLQARKIAGDRGVDFTFKRYLEMGLVNDLKTARVRAFTDHSYAEKMKNRAFCICV